MQSASDSVKWVRPQRLICCIAKLKTANCLCVFDIQRSVFERAAGRSSVRKLIVARDLKSNMPIRLFVGNLPYDTSEAELKDHFSAIGPVAYLTIPKDRETGRVRNFAFVEFSERAQAEEAIRRFNNQLFNGRPLAVSEARPREEGRPTNAPSPARSYTPAEPMTPLPPPSGDKPNRNFGPDAAPPRRGKGKGAPKSERVAKGPMREVVRGQFVGGDDDDDYDDFDDDGYDFDDDHDEDAAENFAEYLNNAKRESDK